MQALDYILPTQHHVLLNSPDLDNVREHTSRDIDICCHFQTLSHEHHNSFQLSALNVKLLNYQGYVHIYIILQYFLSRNRWSMKVNVVKIDTNHRIYISKQTVIDGESVKENANGSSSEWQERGQTPVWGLWTVSKIFYPILLFRRKSLKHLLWHKVIDWWNQQQWYYIVEKSVIMYGL